MIDKWADAVHSGQDIEQADIDQFHKTLTDEYGYVDFYNAEWPGCGGVDEFPFSAICLQECIDNTCGLEGDDILYGFRGILDEYSYMFYFLTHVSSTDGRSAWLLIYSESQGQGGVVQRMEDAFTTPLAAEMSLRADGYIFIGETPSGKVDSFTDEEIFELVRKAAIYDPQRQGAL